MLEFASTVNLRNFADPEIASRYYTPSTEAAVSSRSHVLARNW